MVENLDIFSLTGVKRIEMIEATIKTFRDRLVIIVGLMIMAFLFILCCFVHYNCMNDEPPRRNMSQGREPNASRLLPRELKTPSPGSPKKQPMLFYTDNLPEPASPPRSSTPSSTEMFLRSSPVKSSIPSSAGKLHRLSRLEKSSRPPKKKSLRPPTIKNIR
ncbi:uncharacterized protein CXorf66 homolog [Echinops telfairi]|uniref:Uncharacterized protein CXorf66 homolog n=1 Tax=Echinops telfairi TaxID=9371 RepID=A0AC55CXR0_ECHTE|nr:uncharacterized protein CXorf66 homolog [Echinops telfairi]